MITNSSPNKAIFWKGGFCRVGCKKTVSIESIPAINPVGDRASAVEGAGRRQPLEGQVRDRGRRQDRRDREGEGKGGNVAEIIQL